MKKLIISLLFSMAVMSTGREVQPQTPLAGEDSCQPTSEEILSVIKSSYDWEPSPEKISIAGEIWGGFSDLPPHEKPLTLTRGLAMFGFSLGTKEQAVYLVRRSAAAAEETKKTLKIDLIGILRGIEKDIVLEKGDLVFVSRGCTKGRLMRPRKPASPRWLFPGTDFPVKANDKRIAR